MCVYLAHVLSTNLSQIPQYHARQERQLNTGVAGGMEHRLMRVARVHTPNTNNIEN